VVLGASALRDVGSREVRSGALALERAEGGEKKNAGQEEQQEGAGAGPSPFGPLLCLGCVEIHVRVPRRIGVCDQVESFVTDKVSLV
jgi:hypothetical protein